MWEKFKEWFASRDFPWFMAGWSFAMLYMDPGIANLLLLAFWVWVLSTDN